MEQIFLSEDEFKTQVRTSTAKLSPDAALALLDNKAGYGDYLVQILQQQPLMGTEEERAARVKQIRREQTWLGELRALYLPVKPPTVVAVRQLRMHSQIGGIV